MSQSIVSGHAARERVQVPQLGDWIAASRLKRALLSWALLEGGVLEASAAFPKLPPLQVTSGHGGGLPGLWALLSIRRQTLVDGEPGSGFGSVHQGSPGASGLEGGAALCREALWPRLPPWIGENRLVNDGASQFGLRWPERGMNANQDQIQSRLPWARGAQGDREAQEFLRGVCPLQTTPRYEGGGENLLGVLRGMGDPREGSVQT